MKLSTATAIINISSTLVYAKTSKSAKTEAAKKISGVDDLEGYAMVAKKFIGVNPKNGDGSGFILRADNDIKGDVFPDATIVSNTGRNNMCTCDCVPGPDGIGCVGWAGIAFRYGSLLWKNPFEPSSWQGQMQAYQDAGNDVGFLEVLQVNSSTFRVRGVLFCSSQLFCLSRANLYFLYQFLQFGDSFFVHSKFSFHNDQWKDT